jgi:hypothetical protein
MPSVVGEFRNWFYIRTIIPCVTVNIVNSRAPGTDSGRSSFGYSASLRLGQLIGFCPLSWSVPRQSPVFSVWITPDSVTARGSPTVSSLIEIYRLAPFLSLFSSVSQADLPMYSVRSHHEFSPVEFHGSIHHHLRD